MATAWRPSAPPPSRSVRAPRPMANTATPKTISSSASTTGMYAGPGRWSEPSGKARLSQRVARPMSTSATPATRSTVMARDGSLGSADLLHHLGQPRRVLRPPRVELVRVHVGDGRLELGVRRHHLGRLHGLPGGVAQDLDDVRRGGPGRHQTGPRGVLHVVALRP